MASSSGTSSGSLQNIDLHGEDLQQLMDQRKRKRMTSNRESARRSRMKKQKHLDELMAQLTQLIKENNKIITTMSFTTQNYLKLEAENSMLRAQVTELTSTLQSLNELMAFLDFENGGFAIDQEFCHNAIDDELCYNAINEPASDLYMLNINNSVNYTYTNQLPIMASADMLQFQSHI